MASSQGKWEVVGKGGKPRKITPGTKKNKTKVNEADLPKLDIKDPIPESRTQFDAFTTEKKTPFVIPKDEISESDSDNQDNGSSEVIRRPERRRKHHQKEPQMSLEELVNEALKKCNLPAVKSLLFESQEKYSSNQLAIVKELTAFLQDYFEEMSVEKDPVLGDEGPEFPLCCLADDIQAIVIAELKQCDAEEIDKFFVHCLDELLIEINKGRATYGIRIMIQCLLKCFPLVAIKSKKEYLSHVTSRKKNSREALSLLWALGQTSNHEDFIERITAWTSFMLPVIECKQLSKYVVEYLEMTLRFQSPKKLSDSVLRGREFQYIMELAFATPFQQFPYRRQLQLLFPEIKAVAFASYPSTPLTALFSHLFDSLNNDWGKEYTREALNCLVECLEKDATCHYKWRNNYLVRLKESSLLLKVLVEQWDSVCRSIPRKYLTETLLEFRNVNNDLKHREKQKAGLTECETSCNTLLGVMATTPAPSLQKPSRLTRIFKLLLFILLAVVCVDIYRHRGYEESQTSKLLKRSGVEKGLGTAYRHSKLYAQRLESWAEKRYPYYYQKIRDVIEPASEYTITKLHEVLTYLAEVTAPARAYLQKTVPPLLEKFEDFLHYYYNRLSAVLVRLWLTYFPILKHYLQLAWETLAIYVPLAWSRAKEITWNAGEWFYNLSPEFFDAVADGFRQLVKEVVTRTPHILALVQEYLLTAWKLVVSGVTSIILWFQENVFRGNTINQRAHDGS